MIRPTASRGTTLRFGLGLAFILAGAGFVYWLGAQYFRNDELVRNTLQVIGEIEACKSDITGAEAAVRDFSISGNEMYLKARDAAEESAKTHLGMVEELFRNNPAQLARNRNLRRVVEHVFLRESEFISARRSSGIAGAQRLMELGAGEREMQGVLNLIGQLESEERRLLEQRTEETRRDTKLAYALLVTGTAVSFALLLAVYLALRKEIKQRESAQEQVAEARDQLELRVEERTEQLASANEALAKEIEETALAQAEVSRAHRELSFHFDHTPLAVMEWDSEFRVQSWSNQAERIFGWSKAEVLGHRLNEWRFLLEEDAGLASEFLERIRNGEDPPNPLRTRNYTKQGKLVTCDWYNSVMRNADGTPRSIFSLILDVTERERFERDLERRIQQQKAVAELGARAVSGDSADGLMNEAALRLREHLGADLSGVLELLPASGEFLLRAGAGWPDGIVGSARISAGMDTQAGYTLSMRAPVLVDNLPSERRFPGSCLLRQQGVVCGATVPVQGDSHPAGVLGVFSRSPRGLTSDDVSFLQSVANVIAGAIERSRKEEEIRTLNQDLERRVNERTQQLQAANKELEAFSYSVSHDLRAPLRALDGFSLALLQDAGDKLGDEGKNYCERIRAAAGRMNVLIEDLLRLSRVNLAEIRRESVDLAALARHIVARLREAEPARMAEVVIDEPIAAEGDARLLTVVLENLIGNAWKFTSKTPNAKIHIGAKETERKLVCFVRDNGAGFDMAYAQRLFGPFQRLHSASEFPGTGIGLATVQRIVHRHGGKVWAESGIGNGSTFYFTLSVGREDAGKVDSPGGR